MVYARCPVHVEPLAVLLVNTCACTVGHETKQYHWKSWGQCCAL